MTTPILQGDQSAPYRDVADACAALAREYRSIAAQLQRAARRLENTPPSELAATPIPYVHPRTRALEDALDDALMAL